MRLSKEPLISAPAIADRVAELADEVSAAFAGEEILVVIVLKGAVIFAADLVRRMPVSATLEFVRAKSYAGAASTGNVEFVQLPDEPVTGKHVIIVEDILDTGHTIAALWKRIEADRPAQLALCVLLDKPARRETDVTAAYVGFTLDDQFVVGYGLDYDGRHRHLPDIWVLEGA